MNTESKLEILTELAFDGFVNDIALAKDNLYVLVEHPGPAQHHAPRYSYSLVKVRDGRESSRLELKEDDELTSLTANEEKVYIGGFGQVIVVGNGKELSRIAFRDHDSPGVLVASHGNKIYALDGTYHNADDFWLNLTADLYTLEDDKIQSQLPLGRYESSARRFRTVAADRNTVYVGLANQLKIIRNNQIATTYDFGHNYLNREARNVRGIATSGEIVYLGLDDSTIAILRGLGIESRFSINIPESVTNGKEKWVNETGGTLTCLTADDKAFYAGSKNGYFVLGKKEDHFPVEGSVGSIETIATDNEHIYIGGRLSGKLAIYRKT